MNSQTENQTTLRDIIFILFKHKIIILICFLSVILSATLIITKEKKQIFKSSTTLLLRFGRENIYRNTTPEGTSSITNWANTIERMKTEIEILRSRDLIKSVILDIGIKNIYPWVLFMKSSDNNTTPSIPPIEVAISMFYGSFNIVHVEKSSLLKVSFTHVDPVTAANVVNKLADLFIEKHLRIFQQPEELIFFEDQLNRSREILKKSENDLNIFRRTNNISSILSQKADLLTKVSQFKSLMADTSVQISELEAKLILLNEKEASGETSQMNLDAITSIRSKVTTLKLQEQELLNKYKPSNIKIVNIRAEIEAGENLINSEEMTFFQKEKISVQNDLDALNSKLSAQKEYATIFQNELNVLDRIELKLKALERQVNLDEKSYRLYVSRTEESRISTEMDTQKIANISILNRATPPLFPVRTGAPRSVSFLISIMIGLFFGISVALIVEFKSHSFNHREDISKKLQLKALASIPELKERGFALNKLFERFNH